MHSDTAPPRDAGKPDSREIRHGYEIERVRD
jgi:hypothetical protein